MVSARARRDQADFALSLEASVRRACALMRICRSALRYASTMPRRDAEPAEELRRISREHAGYGYRFAWALIRRGGWTVSKKRVRRLWRALGLSRRPHRKTRKIRTGLPRTHAPTGPNQVWACDFVLDTCASGQVLKAPTVVDEWTRESLAIEVDAKLNAARAIAMLQRLLPLYGTPQVLSRDNGPEFIARALSLWANFKHSEIETIQPVKPWQTGSIESSNGRFRAECLDHEWFANLREARLVSEQWRWEYITKQPHSSLEYRTPAEVGTEARAQALAAARIEAEEVHPITPGLP